MSEPIARSVVLDSGCIATPAAHSVCGLPGSVTVTCVSTASELEELSGE